MTYVWDSLELPGTERLEYDEPLGTKDKFWLVDDGWLWLFKFSRVRNGETRGEDWAEWVVHHLASLIAVPRATIRPARIGERRGIMSRNVVARDRSQRLVLGNSLLAESDIHYSPSITRTNPRYTTAAVKQALQGVSQPTTFEGPESMDGFDVWAGYLILDAWVSGRDRHHENWGVISESGRRSLAPSFDHGNALGFQEGDTKRQACLDDPLQMERWLDHGRSHHFVGRPRLSSVASEAVTAASPTARTFWRARLDAVDMMKVREILAAVPSTLMSDVCSRFTEELLRANLGRMLHEYPAQP